MSRNVKIAPSILAADFARLGDEIRAAEAAGADLIHVDVMDGNFVPNITMGPVVVKSIRPVTDLPLDVHLMIAEPDRYLEDFAKAGADALTFHVEATPHLHRTVQLIHNLGLKAGVAINPGTPASALEAILPFVDIVLVMTVNPGFGGQTFIEQSVGKIARVSAMLDEIGSPANLLVDGGIDANTAGRVVAAGADTLIAGSSVFGRGDVGAAIRALKDAARSHQPS
ncbi:MAG TPA: ribulose-phosphate 3-epimerase [Aggregatilineales bacterium]|nr:ribulose-phosphate 3-epimerase [Aggregatilineales bacterium]